MPRIIMSGSLKLGNPSIPSRPPERVGRESKKLLTALCRFLFAAAGVLSIALLIYLWEGALNKAGYDTI